MPLAAGRGGHVKGPWVDRLLTPFTQGLAVFFLGWTLFYTEGNASATSTPPPALLGIFILSHDERPNASEKMGLQG